MQKKILYLFVAICASFISQNSLNARRFRPLGPKKCENKEKLKVTIKSSGKTENSPFLEVFKKHKDKHKHQFHKEKDNQPALYDKAGLDWAQTTTQNLETAVGYFLSIIPSDQEELRTSLKKKEAKTKERITSAEIVGDQNYKEAEFLADKLSMVANWHKAAQEQLKLVLDKKEEAMGGLMYKDFTKAKADSQKELLFEIYAMLDGIFPNPRKPVDQEKLNAKINEVVEEVFSKIEKPKTKAKKRAADKEKQKENNVAQETLGAPKEEAETENSEIKKLQESESKLKKDLADAQKALKDAEKEKAEALSKAEKLKQEVESEQKNLKAEEIKREIELKRTAAEKTKLENKNAALEKKIQELEDKKLELKSKMDALSENVKQESFGKTMTSIDLEKIRRQKEALEKKLEKQTQKINEYLSLLSASDAKQKENSIKQINLEIEIKRLKGRISELEAEKVKNSNNASVSTQKSSEKTNILKTPIILDVEKDSKKLAEQEKPETKKTILHEAQSLFDEFPNQKTEPVVATKPAS